MGELLTRFHFVQLCRCPKHISAILPFSLSWGGGNRGQGPNGSPAAAQHPTPRTKGTKMTTQICFGGASAKLKKQIS